MKFSHCGKQAFYVALPLTRGGSRIVSSRFLDFFLRESHLVPVSSRNFQEVENLELSRFASKKVLKFSTCLDVHPRKYSDSRLVSIWVLNFSSRLISAKFCLDPLEKTLKIVNIRLEAPNPLRRIKKVNISKRSAIFAQLCTPFQLKCHILDLFLCETRRESRLVPSRLDFVKIKKSQFCLVSKYLKLESLDFVSMPIFYLSIDLKTHTNQLIFFSRISKNPSQFF